ncbi:MAG: hypothetical protein AB7T06_13095 [Kofleriaceae bacterium]
MVIARSVVLAVLLSGVAYAWPPSAPRLVPMLLVDPPATFDRARFATSLETYVTNASVVPSPRGAASDEDICNAAFSAARDVQSPVAMWARWSETGMTVSMVSIDKSDERRTRSSTEGRAKVDDKDCGVVESTTIDVPADQPDFVYRVAALKVASLLRSLPDETAEVPAAPPREKLAWQERPLHVRRPSYGAVDIGVTGVASTEAAARTYGLVASAWVKTRFHPTWRGEPETRFSVGVTLLASASHEADASGGTGSARLFGALLGGRARIARAGRLELVAEIDAGVASVWSSADRSNGAEAMSERVWTPIASLAPRLRVAVVRPFHVILGPSVDISRSISLALGQTPLYRASWLRFRWDIRAELWF